MALSMTGFGRGAFACELFAIRVELRAVNHRFLEINLRLPRSLGQFEERLRREINAHVGRGKIDATISYEDRGPGMTKVRLDRCNAAGYRDALLELAALCGLPARLQLEHFIRLPDLFTIEESPQDEEALWNGISAAAGEALRALTAMRRLEGEKLLADLGERVKAIEGCLARMEERAPVVPEIYRQQLAKRLTEVLGQTGLDEIRLAQEVAIYADRCNIAEELVRLRSHLGQLRETLAMDGALGRKADFILQEINRETNTIGSKANDLSISQAVIEAKTELEKIREQVQNLE